MASFSHARTGVVVLYTIVGEDPTEGTNAFRIDHDPDKRATFGDFLRRFPLRGYGEQLQFEFKSVDEKQKTVWSPCTDPQASLPVYSDGNVHAKVLNTDGEGFVASDIRPPRDLRGRHLRTPPQRIEKALDIAVFFKHG